MRTIPFLSLCGLVSLTLLLSGCVVPGYPYSGYAPYETIPSGAPPPPAAPLIVPAPGVAAPYPYLYAPAPVLIAPAFYAGYGTGYWYGGHYWPYRPGCAFYSGCYYGGYGAHYWRRGNNWHGYHGGGHCYH